MLAWQWGKDFMTRENMRKKWGRALAISECFAELWEHEGRNNSSGIF